MAGGARRGGPPPPAALGPVGATPPLNDSACERREDLLKDALGSINTLLVLGGTSEIGLATADLLVRQGCRTVVLASRRPLQQQADAEQLRSAGATRVESVAFDAADPAGHVDLVAEVRRLVGDIDVALLAFGVLGDQAQFDADPVAAAQAVTTNYTGAVSVGLALARALTEQGHGTLVLLSSVAGVRPRKANFVYGSSKAGLDAFGQGLGDALQGTGAHVLVVRPGFVHTQMTAGMTAAPLSTTAPAVAEIIVSGLARGANVVWAPAALQMLFAVLRVLPRSLWRRLPG